MRNETRIFFIHSRLHLVWFLVVLSSLSAFSKEIVWAITILLISQILIHHSFRQRIAHPADPF